MSAAELKLRMLLEGGGTNGTTVVPAGLIREAVEEMSRLEARNIFTPMQVMEKPEGLLLLCRDGTAVMAPDVRERIVEEFRRIGWEDVPFVILQGLEPVAVARETVRGLEARNVQKGP